jgi:hypothetical protein
MPLGQDAPGMIDTYGVQDIFVSGLGEIEQVGGNCLRFVLYSQQHIGEAEQRIVVARLIVPLEQVPVIMRTVSKDLGICICEALKGAVN